MAKISMKISHTVIREVEIDLDEWYSYKDMTAREKHECIESLKDDYSEIYTEGNRVDEDEDWDLLNWDLYV